MVTVTGSSKLTTIFALVEMVVAPLLGLVVVTLGGASVVKVDVNSTRLLGGSSISLSAIDGNTETVQVVASGKPEGVRMTVVVLAGKVAGVVTVNPLGVPAGHSKPKSATDAISTNSLKVMVMVVVFGTLTAPLAGVIVKTVGAASMSVVKEKV